MSRRKQARPQHYATSEEELDDEPETGEGLGDLNSRSIVKAVSTTTTTTNGKSAVNHSNETDSDFDTELYSKQNKLYKEDEQLPSVEEEKYKTEVDEEEEANNENLNSVNLTPVLNRKRSPKRESPVEKPPADPTEQPLPLSSVINHQQVKQPANSNILQKVCENGDVVNPKAFEEVDNGQNNHKSPTCELEAKVKGKLNDTFSPLRSNLLATMKSLCATSSGSSGSKNLCDKCGGSYATLAALISHKKSCKGTMQLNRSKRIPLGRTEEDGEEQDSDHEGDQETKVTDNVAVNPLSSWPSELLPPSMLAAVGGGNGGDIHSLLESLAPMFTAPNLEQPNDTSPNSDEHQQHQQQQAALLMTQQMMFFHMLQQLQGAPHIPPLPLIAAAAAAAAAASHTPTSSPPVRPPAASAVAVSATIGAEDKPERNISRSLFPPECDEQKPLEEKDSEDLRRPPSASSTSTSLSASAAASSSARKLLSSLLDLKDTNPDAPLPPMMSPPKTDSTEPAMFNEPNTLELLQKHTEQALQNTMSGGSFLLNGLSAADNNDLLNFRKGKDGKEDPTCRHRCKFCGKVFGSDSALQIHIRSHTGERPFKCNICGNRFTTKGNLKVHFQRHKAKYPNVKMNPHPVPEHLDKFHPPLEPPSNSQSPPPPPPGLFSTSTPNNGLSGPFGHSNNTLHIPAIFSSTLIPFESDDKPETKAAAEVKNKRSFDFADLYKSSNLESKTKNQSMATVFGGDDSSKSAEHNGQGQSDNEENSQNKNDGEESDTDIDDEEQGAIDLKKKPEPVNGHWNKKKDELTDDESNDKQTSKDDEGNKADIDSDEEISDNNTQYDSATLPPTFGLMGLPFGVDPAAFTGSLPLPGQSFGRGSDKDSDISEAAAKDPIFYQNLLPKPGSTDNTWETLMEVQKASETVKLQQLVDNIEHKLNDPNQCIICQRVLSCKSALQMHYRTHTGERPFKCKICGRAFTTKGNLKTHMGVHRVKPPLRMLHQCPICHKQFTNALVLQQHIRLHQVEPNPSSNPGEINVDMLNELKNNPLLPTNFSRAFLPTAFGGPFSLPPVTSTNLFSQSFISELTNQQMSKNSSLMSPFQQISKELTKDKKEETKLNENEDQKEGDQQQHSTRKEKRKMESKPLKLTVADDVNSVSDSTEIDEEFEVQQPIKKQKKNEQGEEKKENDANLLSALENHVMKSTAQISPQSKPFYSKSDSSKESVLDLTPKSDDSKNDSSDSRSFPSTPFAGLPYHPTGRPNTTCRICLKTFACFSALEIHYRSHTKERPFKCEVCDRGFSTKGNMKQHMLTHKIRDLPPDLYTTVSPSSNTTLGNFLTSSNISKLIGKQSTTNSSNNSNNSSRVSSPHTPNGNNSNSVDSVDKFESHHTIAEHSTSSASSCKTSGSNKHLCTICNKPFSSGSALQIHMRTHTGDKPFKCTICGRAFTTKGNLKVHMGTHMWNNNPSRRGRRMSIDLPNLHISPPVKQQQHPATPAAPVELTNSSSGVAPPPPPNPANPELFFPYLSSHFLNGPDANQLAIQQMMFMKMMSSQQAAAALPPLSLEKRNEEMSNTSLNGDDDKQSQQQVLCEPEIDLEESSNDPKQKYYDDEEEENRSYRSDHSNSNPATGQPGQSNGGWPLKQWKMPCTICSHISNSPEDLEQHIKAHLHAAVTASAAAATSGDPANKSKTAAGVIS